MTQNLRESDELSELEDRSDSRIINYVFRLLQLASGVGGTGYAIHSVAEKGLSTDALVGTAIGILGPLILEYLVRINDQSINEMYDKDTGVVEK